MLKINTVDLENLHKFSFKLSEILDTMALFHS